MDLKKYLLEKISPTYTAYYNGKMSYRLHGKEWERFVSENLNDVIGQTTSENIFKDVVDMYAENLIPNPLELKGFKSTLVPLLTRGESIGILTKEGNLTFPEEYEIVSDGDYTIAAVFTRSLQKGKDYVTFIDSQGYSELWEKSIPADMSKATRLDYEFVEQDHGHKLYRFALDDRGLGPAFSSLQDRINHSIIDQTVIAEMYTRPFWYLLNYQAPPVNPYLPQNRQPDPAMMTEQKGESASGRIFATSSEGPFGQLEPPTLGDMVSYHDSLIRKVSQSSGIPEFYFKPSASSVPSGAALRVLSNRFNNRVARIREAIEPVLLQIAKDMGVTPEDGEHSVTLWSSSNDLLQDSLDAHGLNLTQMGYPLNYIAEVVTPGVNLEDYDTDGYSQSSPSYSIATGIS